MGTLIFHTEKYIHSSQCYFLKVILVSLFSMSLSLSLSQVPTLRQRMYGCDWDDDEDVATAGYFQDGYDGEDFIAFDLQTLTWIAPTPQALPTKQSWDQDRAR